MAVETLHQPDPTTFNEARSTAAAYLQSRLALKGKLTDEDFTIPIIDISSSFSASLAIRQAVAAQIRTACTTSGFFYITGHGVPESSRQKILHQSERFFRELSREQKEDLHTNKSSLGYGWEPGEYTSLAGDLESKEAFNFGYEEGLDRTGGDGEYRNLDGSKECGNMWPGEERLPGFYGEVKEYYGAVSLVLHLIKRLRGKDIKPLS